MDGQRIDRVLVTVPLTRRMPPQAGIDARGTAERSALLVRPSKAAISAKISALHAATSFYLCIAACR